MSAPRRKRYSITISTGAKELQANHLALYTPDLKDVVSEIKTGLESNYKNVECAVLDKCPDLSEWGNLSTKGICGSTRIAEVGGLPYLYNSKYQKKTKYQLPDIVKACGLNTALVFGSAHASPNIIGKTGELVVNSKVPGPRHTRYAKIDKIDDINDDNKDNKDEQKQQQQQQNNDKNNDENKKNDNNDSNANKDEEEKDNDNNDNNKNVKGIEGPMVNFYPSEEVGCASNLFLCDGNCDEPVLYIKVSVKTGKLNLINSIREALKKIKGVDQSAQIGVGGIIKVTAGKVKAYITPDFVELDDYNDTAKIEKTRKYYEFGPNLIMFTTFLTDDPSENGKLHLTMDATNCYSLNHHCNEGGCYVDTTTNDTIQYEGYLNLAKYIYRVEDAYYNIQVENSMK